MKKPLRLLLVEDNEADAELALRELRKTGREIECRRVESAEAFLAALAHGESDLVIADYTLPAFSGMEALRLLRTAGLDVPFILVSGNIGEELAVEAMRDGASDYLLKNNLNRLAPAVERELRDSAERRERRRVEKALEESRRFLQEITDRIPGVVFRFRRRADGEMAFDFVSGGALALFERPPEQIVADFSNAWGVVVPEDRDALNASIIRTVTEMSAWEHEFRIRTPGGKLKWVRGNAVPAGKDQDGTFSSVGTLVDATAHKEAEEAVRQSEERYRSIFESIQDVYFEVAPDGVIMEISPSSVQVLGDAPQNLLGRNLAEYLVHAGDWKRVVNEIVRRQRVNDLEFRARNRGGLSFQASVSAQLVRDETGVPVRIRGVLRDVTERRRAEESRSRLEAQLRQAQKMEAIGTLAGGIAHDFNNMLTAIMGHAELLRLDCANLPGVLDSVEEVLKAAYRAKELVQQILTFSRRREQKRVVTKLSPIVKEAAKLLRASIPSTVEMMTQVADVPNVLADPTQIHQVVMNLCTNAAQAIGSQPGRLEIKLQVESVDAAVASQHHGLQPRRYVVLTVRDSGCGMDPVTLERVFDPFFTTKPPGEGTGLGLAVVHAIVENHEGAITVESQVGQGTTFHVYLPVIEAELAPAQTERPAVPLGNNEEILVVDDEPPILQIAERLLARMGYRAICFNRPADAIAVFEHDPQRFPLVMTDLTMPKITGLDLAQRIHKLRANVPIILISGLGGSVTDETARKLGFTMLLAKPFEYVALAEALSKALSASRSGETTTILRRP